MLINIKKLSCLLNNKNCCWLIARLNTTMVWKKNLGCKAKKFQSYKELIIENLNLDAEQAVSFLLKNHYIFDIPKDKIKRNCAICQQHNVQVINTENSNYHFLEMNEDQLENTIKILKEIGASSINTHLLIHTIQQVNMKLLKTYCKIPKDEDTAARLYSYFHKPPANVPPLEPLDYNVPVHQFRFHCLVHYLHWRLDMPLSKVKLRKKMKHKLLLQSFQSIKESFDILHYDIGLPINVIRDNKCLEGCSPLEIKKIIENVDSVCGIPIIKLFHSCPMLSKVKYKGLFNVKNLLESCNFTQTQLENCVKILLLDEKKVKSGLQILMRTPELQVLINHPNVLQILILKNKINERLEYLSYLRIKDITVNILIRGDSTFDKVIKSSSRKFKHKEIIIMLANYSLADDKTLRNILDKHPHWKHVDLITIHQSLQFLINSFETADIIDNLTLILYPRHLIKSTILRLENINNLSPPSDRYSKSELLPLCEYEIEKNFHFSGNGIWQHTETEAESFEKNKNYDSNEWNIFLPNDSLNSVNNYKFVDKKK